jgi:hypothetical protein
VRERNLKATPYKRYPDGVGAEAPLSLALINNYWPILGTYISEEITEGDYAGIEASHYISKYELSENKLILKTTCLVHTGLLDSY